ncbi:E3 SUMO-protein ligase ZBED1-like protein [Lates japonicus]|uniref:E3 SUMO-protein ligase ZBED1-like protein n=1 Tax=Lates japonicus TaxID=270547 RepID=A0AAD3N4D6_LATJO|nr:E3 SUMO-protein ligase ZBED1-like protein [Lates japonicus]
MTVETSNGVLNGSFRFKRFPDESLLKTKVVCPRRWDELSFHRGTTRLKYHLRAKHIFANVSKDASTETGCSRQTTPGEFSQDRPANNTTTMLTNAIAKWIATDCRPNNTVEDQGLQRHYPDRIR